MGHCAEVLPTLSVTASKNRTGLALRSKTLRFGESPEAAHRNAL
jgi:hypothetical protein